MQVTATVLESKINRIAFDVCLIETALKDTPFKIIDWKTDVISRPDNEDNLSQVIIFIVSYTERVDMSHGDPFLSYTAAPQV